MKNLLPKNKIYAVILILLFISILTIPLYQIRIPTPFFNIGLLSIFFTFFILISVVYGHKDFWKQIFDKKTVLFLFFPLSFLSSAFSSSIHGLGVFFEWIIIPSFLGVTICALSKKNQYTHRAIILGLTIIYFGVIIFSLFEFFSGNTTYDNRLSSFFLSPNHLAMFIVPLAFIACSFFYMEKIPFKKIFIILTLVLAIFILTLTQSLSSFIGFAGSCFFLAITFFQKKYLLLFGTIICVITVFFCTIKLQSIDSAFERNSLSSRITIWKTTLLLIQKSPLLGYPIDSFQEQYLQQQRYYPPYLEWTAPTPHNLYLTVWFSGGFFSLYSLLLLVSCTIFHAFYLVKNKKNSPATFYCAGFIAIVISGFLDTPYWKNDLAIIFWLILSLTLSTPPPKTTKEGKALH